MVPVSVKGELYEANQFLSPDNFAFEAFGLVVSIPIDLNDELKNSVLRFTLTITFTGGT